MTSAHVTPAEVERIDEASVGRRKFGLNVADVAGLALTLVGFIIGSRVIADNSFLTHLATGGLIADRGAVPSTDVYSYIAAGEPWTVQSWFPSLVYFLLFEAFGGWSVRILNGLLVAALVHNLWKMLAVTEQLLVRVVLASCCIGIGVYMWTPRPLLFGLLGFVLLMRIERRSVSVAWLPPILYLWVNSHGSFPIAGVYVLFVLVGEWLDTRQVSAHHRRLLVVGLATGLVSVINPVGWRLLWFPVHLLSRRDALESVAEWSSPSFTSPFEWLLLGLFALIVVAARRSADWQRLLPAGVFALTALLALRNFGFASIVIAVSVAPSLAGLVGSLEGRHRSRAVSLAGGGLAAVAAIVMFGVAVSPATSLERYPVSQVAWLEERSLVAQEDVRIAQRDFVGNYLGFEYRQDARIFVDDRFDFYPQPVLDDHRNLVFGGDFSEIVERRGFNVVLWETNVPFAYWLAESDDWRVALVDDHWLVACRVGSQVDSRCR